MWWIDAAAGSVHSLPACGEGWGGGDCAFLIRRTHMPPPCPSPASGEGDAGADGSVLPKALA